MTSMAMVRRSAPPAPAQHGELRLSRYDQVSGMLLAALIVMGVVTLAMFLIWLSHRLIFVTPAVPVTVLEDVGGGGSGTVLGNQPQFEEPSSAEMPQAAASEVPVAQTLESIGTMVAAKVQDFDAVVGSPSVGSGQGTGMGDGRGPGPGGPGTSDGI